MPTLQVRVWAENPGVGVRQRAAETMGIWQDMGGLTTQWIDNTVRERIWEIAQSKSIINKQGAGLSRWDLLIDCCVTPNCDLVSKRPLWKWYMADKTNLDGQKLKAALDVFVEVGLRGRNSVSNGSNPLVRFRVRVGTGTEPWQRCYHMKNPDRWHLGRFPPQNPAIASPDVSLQLSI